MGKKIILFFTSIVTIILLAACGGAKTNSVELTDYVDVSFAGVDTVGVADYQFDIEGAISDVYGWEHSEFDEEMYALTDKNPKVAEEAHALYEAYDITVEPSENLSNGDEVTVTINVNEEITEDFIGGKETFTVEGLEELDVLTEDEVKKHIVVDFIGAHEEGKARIENTFSNEFSSIDFVIENDGNLKNGDQAKLVLEGGNDVLFDMGYRLEEDFNVTYEVKGLREYPASVKDIKNRKDIDRLLSEEIDKNFEQNPSSDTYSRYAIKEELVLYRQYDDDVSGHFNPNDPLPHGSYVKLYTVKRFKNQEKQDADDYTEAYVYMKGFENTHIDEDGKVNITELKGVSTSHDASYSLETVQQIYEGNGYEVVKD